MNTELSLDQGVGYGTKSYRSYALGALLLVYVFEVVDRILLAMLQEKVRVDLSLSDFQLGLLSGPAFVLLYVACAMPIARLAERSHRVTIVSAGVAFFSAATAMCGLAQNFIQLFVARMAVGVGEAACVPASQSIISSYFPSKSRASALGIYSLAIPIGTLVAAFGGGWLAQTFNWRVTFLVLGALGVASAILVRLTVKEPPRADANAPKFFDVLKYLGAKRSFIHVVSGVSVAAIFGFALSNFFVSYAVREYALELSEAAFAFGIIFGFGAAAGIFLGGFLSDRLAGKFPSAITWLPAVGLLLATPLYALAFWQSSFSLACMILAVAMIVQFMSHAPGLAIIQQVAQPRMRATAAAILMMSLTLVGYGLGPPVCPSSDNLRQMAA